MSDQEFVEVNGNGFVPIKATPKNTMPLMKKKVLERVDQLNAKQRQTAKPPQFDSMEEYLKDKIKRKTTVPGGGVVVGNFSEDERKAVQAGDERLLRKQAILRDKAMRIMRERRMEGKTQRDHFQAYRSYEALSKYQGRLPNAPKDVNGRTSFLEGE